MPISDLLGRIRGRHRAVRGRAVVGRVAANGAVALGAAAALALALHTASTGATLKDSAVLRAAAHGRYTVAVLDSDGGITRVSDGTDTVALTVRPPHGLLPGNTMSISITLAGNTPGARTVPQLAVEAAGALLGTDAGSVAPYLRISAEQRTGEDGRTLVGDPEHPELGVGLTDEPLVLPGIDELAPRRGAPQKAGETWDGGDAARTTLVVHVHLLDAPALRAAAGQQLALTFSITGRSSS